MTAYAATDQVAGQGSSDALPNFVGELFSLSPKDTPLLSLIGGLTGGKSVTAEVFTWQDTIHRAPAIQANAEGADATFSSQKRNERSNVVMIHQYGVELTYTKQSTVGRLGTTGTSPAIAATSILGTQPVQNEMAWQLQIKLEQAALDVEVVFLDGTLANPNDGTARQTQGIRGAVAAGTTTDYALVSGQEADDTVVNDLAKKLYDVGAPGRNQIVMVNSLGKVELGNSYQAGGNLQPRSMTKFGVNIQSVETEFGPFDIVLNRHLDEDEVLILDLDVMSPCFLAAPGGHFFLEPLAKAGSYDRHQLYGEIGLEYGPSQWHAKAENLHAP